MQMMHNSTVTKTKHKKMGKNKKNEEIETRRKVYEGQENWQMMRYFQRKKNIKKTYFQKLCTIISDNCSERFIFFVC